MKSKALRRKPLYLLMAADLRAHVKSGRLLPGERLPSTRSLARAHGIALATAAHVLRTLIDEGIAEAIPGVGTVVARNRAAASVRGRDTELSLNALVRVAVAMADAEGLDALSIRGVAAKLGASPMALYRHIGGKEDLLNRMVAATLQEEQLPRARVGDWRAQLEVASRLEWRILRRHPWLARLISVSRPRPLPIALNLTEWVLSALEHTGLSPPVRMQVHIMLHGYIQGLGVNVEEEARAAGDTGMTDEDWMRTQEGNFRALGVQFPTFGRFLHEVRDGFDFDFDQLFEFGLQAMLDGVSAMIAAAAGRRRKRARPKRPSARRMTVS